MKNYKKRLNFFAITITFFVGLLFAAQSLNAQSLLDKQEGFGGQGKDNSIAATFTGGGQEPTDVRVIVAKTAKAFLGLMGIILVIIIIYSGFLWMTAGGNEERVGEAKKRIAQAVIGLIIILSAWGIAQHITSCLVRATGGESSVFLCPDLN